jgi:hypothetical protein
MATLGDTIVLFGGAVGSVGSELQDTWVLSGTTWTRVRVSSSPPARIGATMATLGNEVVLFGGESSGGPSSAPRRDTWVFDGVSWKQIIAAGPPPARVWASMATLGKEVVLFGGTADLGTLFQDTWAFDGTAWKKVSVSASPPARAYAALATTP